MTESFTEYENKSPEELNILLQDVENNLVNYKMILNVESEKMDKYKVIFKGNRLKMKGDNIITYH